MSKVLLCAYVLVLNIAQLSSLQATLSPVTSCENNLDIILLFDSSESVQDVWSSTIDHAEAFEYNFVISNQHSRFGIIDYSIIANVYKHLDSNNSNEETYQILEELRKRPQKSRSAFERGVGWALELFAAAKKRQNPGKKLLIVYTDATWSTVQSSVMEDYVSVLRLQKIEVVFFLVKEIKENNVLHHLINPVRIFLITNTTQSELVQIICDDKELFQLDVFQHTSDVGTKKLNQQLILDLIISNTSFGLYSTKNITDNFNHSKDDVATKETQEKQNSIVSLTTASLFNNLIPQYTPYAYSRPDTNFKIVRSPSEKELALYSNNFLRSLHGAPKLVWDNALASQSQKWADRLVSENRGLYHSERDGQDYGENIYSIRGLPQSQHIHHAAKYWYEGVKYYRFENPGFTWQSGTFTQMIWYDTKKIGVGVAFRPDIQTTIIVAQYSPPGNYLNQFAKQVRRPLAGLPARLPELKELIPPYMNMPRYDLCAKGKCQYGKVSASVPEYKKKT
ncbi:uncharacterized protein LOC100198915 isoform X1 [Hydra vulgaris]|uniref:uncharacterized protein LOC100198915 isoform X1 n=1 Tax=Hydra vulgaris TaxID=6087 RepID=UPI001F5F03A7|nr:uncharacterized protein LOC100198915 isoform X1 [Hydra vulgaris]